MVRSGIWPSRHHVRSTVSSRKKLQGFRSLDDLRNKAKLSHNQQVGLKYYDEFLERIPRDEVTEIEGTVSSTR